MPRLEGIETPDDMQGRFLDESPGVQMPRAAIGSLPCAQRFSEGRQLDHLDGT